MTLVTVTTQQRARFEKFANFGAIVQGWYPVARARRLKPGTVTSVWIGERELVLYRALSGELRALDKACGHLGADLSQGTVTDKGLRCVFHHWCWDGDGACAAGGGAPHKRRMRAYATRERWGLAWVWAGDAPAYDLPEPEPQNGAHVLTLPEQRLDCHPHVMLGNGLDVTHVVPVHGFRFEHEPTLTREAPHRLSVDVHARFGPTFMRRVLGLAGEDARWRFTCIGPSLAWVKVTHPTPFELVWAGRPLPGGGTAAQTIFFLPKRRAMVRAVPMMVATTIADRDVLNGVEFRPGFVPSDATFEAYAHLIEAMPAWEDVR